MRGSRTPYLTQPVILRQGSAALAVSEAVEHQASYKRDSGEVMVQGENASLMFKSNGCDQGVNGGARYAFSARCAIDCSRGAIGFKAPGLQHVPLRSEEHTSELQSPMYL